MVETTTMERSTTTEIGKGLSFEMDQMALYDALNVFKSMHVSEVLMSCADDGIRIAATDALKTKLCVEYIDAKKCVRYSSKEISFGMKLNDLRGVLMYIKGTIRFSEKDEKVTVEGANGFVKTFPVMEERLVVNIPQINYETGAVVNGKAFYTALSVAADMAEEVTLTADKVNLIVSASVNEKEMELPVKILKGGFKGEEGQKSNYGSEDLRELAKNFRKGDIMVRFTATNKTGTGKDERVEKIPAPAKINFKFGDNGRDDVRGYILYAPRIPR